MPVRNAELFVLAAVDSLLKQSFSDFEFIIVDDASTDDTKPILDLIDDFRIIRQYNPNHSGNYKCRNQGLDLAQGKYICVMDADDMSHPDRLQIQVDFMEENTKYIACGSDIEFFSARSKTYLFTRSRDTNRIKVELLKDNVSTHPTLMIRREAFDQYRIRYNEDYYYAGDYDLMVQLSHIGKITNLPEPLLRYRLHDNQISSAKHGEQTMYADHIRLKQLYCLKVRPSIDEIMIHLSLMKSQPVPKSKLTLAEKWCNKLLAKNHKLQIYDPEQLYRFLEEQLKTAVLNSK